MLVAPNGNIFVSEGHSSAEGSNARILKFDKSGKFIKSFGKLGKGPGEFDQPHALAMDSKGRLFVGDRSNNRIQILDQDGNFIAEWTQFSRPSGIAIDRERQHLRRRLGIGLGQPGARRVDARHPHRQRQGRQCRSAGSSPDPRDAETLPQHQRRRRRRGRPRRATSTAPKSDRAR